MSIQKLVNRSVSTKEAITLLVSVQQSPVHMSSNSYGSFSGTELWATGNSCYTEISEANGGGADSGDAPVSETPAKVVIPDFTFQGAGQMKQ